jgi:hypothetical protein
MEFEQLHANMCPAPTLARFQGMDGFYSPKAKLFNFLGVEYVCFVLYFLGVEYVGVVLVLSLEAGLARGDGGV